MHRSALKCFRRKSSAGRGPGVSKPRSANFFWESTVISKNQTIILGAVAYDPKVVTIWDGFRTYFIDHGLDFDYVLFSNYERQVQALFEGLINVAWNSPLAWLECERVAAAAGHK